MKRFLQSRHQKVTEVEDFTCTTAKQLLHLEMPHHPPNVVKTAVWYSCMILLLDQWKGILKLNYLFPLSPLTPTHHFPSVWSSLLFPSLWHRARPHLYPSTSATHTVLLSSAIMLSSGLCSGTCSRILDCHWGGITEERGELSYYIGLCEFSLIRH